MSHTKPSMFRGVTVLGAIILVIAGLHFVSRFGLSGPESMTLDSIQDWASEPGAVIATIARWLSLILAYYLAVVIGASLFLGDKPESETFERFTPASVTGLVGLLLGTSAVVAPMAMHEVPVAESTHHATQAPLVLGQLEDPLVLSDALTLSQSSVEVPNLVWNETGSEDDEWTVENGDSFWSIAEETLHDQTDVAELSEEEIADYWRILIAANEDRLIEPGNPDLILPGQELVLPPTPGR